MSDEASPYQVAAAEARRLTAAMDNSDQARLALGLSLLEARKAWPASGPDARGWGEFLEDIAIGQRSARRYMKTAQRWAVRP